MAETTVDLFVIGSQAAGKTMLVSQFCCGKFENDYLPTIEDSFVKKFCWHGILSQVRVTDTSGDENLWKESWTDSGSAYMLVYDSHSRESFALATRRATEIRSKERLHLQGQAPILIVANKIDSEGDYWTRKDIVVNAKKFARQTGCKFMDVCAQNAFDVEKAFTTIISEALSTSVTFTAASTQTYSFLERLGHAFSCFGVKK